MGLFGNKGSSSRERSAADREAARVERERRRAEREGRAVPAEAAAADAASEGTEQAAPDEQHPADGDRGAPAEPHPADGPAEPHPADAERAAAAPQPPETEWGAAAEPFAPEPEAPGAEREAEPPAPDREPPGAGRASAHGHEPAAADPEVPLRPPEPEPAPRPRRTVALPRPQTRPHANGQVAEEEPIGVVRAGRASYAAQPGAAAPGHQRLTVPPKRRRRTRRIVALATIFLFVALVVIFAILLFQPFAGDGAGTVRVRIPPGAGAGEIGDQLAQAGRRRLRLLLLPARPAERPARRPALGHLHDAPRHVATRRRSTSSRRRRAPRAVLDVTLPEGPSRRELAPRVRQAGIEGDYLAATRRSGRLDPRDYGAPRSTRNLEGFLFPATYELRSQDATARRLVARQVEAFKDTFARVDLTRARRRNLSRYDVLIIASMVEREVLVPRERRLIAGVIYNRLQQGIPLGIDATIRYARNNWSRPLRQSELQADSPYNTRLRRGLPPTPIGNPGLAAMRPPPTPPTRGPSTTSCKPLRRTAPTASRRPRPSSSATSPPTTASARSAAARTRRSAEPVRRLSVRVPRLGVLGWPVAHSRSPAMHNAALAALGLAPDWRYQLLPVPPELLAETVRALPAAGFRGRERHDPPQGGGARARRRGDAGGARAIGAANTLTLRAGRRDPRRQHRRAGPARRAARAAPRPHRALILGAGGQRPRRRLRAARGRRRRRGGLEPDPGARARRSPPTSACAPSRRPSRPTCSSTARRSASTMPMQRSRTCRWAPMTSGIRVRGRPRLPGRRHRAPGGGDAGWEHGGRRPGDPGPPGRAEPRDVDRHAGAPRGDASGGTGPSLPHHERPRGSPSARRRLRRARARARARGRLGRGHARLAPRGRRSLPDRRHRRARPRATRARRRRRSRPRASPARRPRRCWWPRATLAPEGALAGDRRAPRPRPPRPERLQRRHGGREPALRHGGQALRGGAGRLRRRARRCSVAMADPVERPRDRRHRADDGLRRAPGGRLAARTSRR